MDDINTGYEDIVNTQVSVTSVELSDEIRINQFRA